jgi:DNA damage-binding protein 1
VHRITEINLFSLCFLDVDEVKTLALLYLDNKERIQLRTRNVYADLKNSQVELSQATSSVLLPTVVPSRLYSLPDAPPRLIPIPSPSGNNADFSDGVLIIGGKKILFFGVAAPEAQEKHRGKQERLQQKRKSSDKAKEDQALEKEKEREARGRKPNASVVWPWSNVTA